MLYEVLDTKTPGVDTIVLGRPQGRCKRTVRDEICILKRLTEVQVIQYHKLMCAKLEYVNDQE